MDLDAETKGRGASLLCAVRGGEVVGYCVLQRTSLVARAVTTPRIQL